MFQHIVSQLWQHYFNSRQTIVEIKEDYFFYKNHQHIFCFIYNGVWFYYFPHLLLLLLSFLLLSLSLSPPYFFSCQNFFKLVFCILVMEIHIYILGEFKWENKRQFSFVFFPFLVSLTLSAHLKCFPSHPPLTQLLSFHPPPPPLKYPEPHTLMFSLKKFRCGSQVGWLSWLHLQINPFPPSYNVKWNAPMQYKTCLHANTNWNKILYIIYIYEAKTDECQTFSLLFFIFLLYLFFSSVPFSFSLLMKMTVATKTVSHLRRYIQNACERKISECFFPTLYLN